MRTFNVIDADGKKVGEVRANCYTNAFFEVDKKFGEKIATEGKLEQRHESGQLDTIVTGTMIATAGNAVNALSSIISGVANGRRKDLLEIDLQNAKDQIEALTKYMKEYQ